MTLPRKRIGEMLLQDGLITAAQLDHALKSMQERGGRIVENLIALGYIDTKSFLTFVSRQPGIASLDLLNYTIPKEVVALIDPDFARKHELVPLDKMGPELTVGMSCPLDERTLQELREKTGLKVRPMLVSISDVRVALDRYYPLADPKKRALEAKDFGLMPLPAPAAEPAPAEAPKLLMGAIETALRFERVLHLVRQIESLPALPETVNAVQRAASDPECSTKDLAAIIGRDPGIGAKVISLANSPAYGFRHKVDSIERATTLLGVKETVDVVLGSSVMDFFKSNHAFDYTAFWRRSLYCATAAKLTAKTCHLPGEAGYFSGALLQDIGRVAMAFTLPELYNVLNQKVTDTKLIQEEQSTFSIGHPEVGYVLANHWDLPVEICDAIRYHNEVEQALKSGTLASVVAFTSILSDYALLEGETSMHDLLIRCEPFSDALKLDESKVTGIMEIARIALENDLFEAL